MTTTDLAAHDAAAQALTEALPLAQTVRATRSAGAPVGTQVTQAVALSLAGDIPAEVAIALIDTSDVATDDEGAGTETVPAALAPALEAAAEAVTTGVASPAIYTDATGLFSDPSSAVYELVTDDGGATIGWFAVRATAAVQSTSARDDSAGSIGLIADVPMTLTVQIGNTDMTVREALDLAPNQVVQLDRAAGEPADILINGRLIAKGTVVVVDSDYGVKVTEVLDPTWTP